MATLITLAEARQRLGDMPKSTFMLLVRQGMPREGDGKTARYPWPDIWHWYLRRERDKAVNAAQPKDRNEAEERLASAKAQLAELELEEARGNLAKREDVTKAFAAIHERVRAKLVSLPGKAAPALVGMKRAVDVQVALEGYIEEVVDELRDFDA